MTEKAKSQGDMDGPARSGAAAGAQTAVLGVHSVYVPGGVSGNINTGTQTHIDTHGGDYVNINVASGKPPPLPPYPAPLRAGEYALRPREIALIKQDLLDAAGDLLPTTVGIHGFGGVGKTMLARMLCDNAAIHAAASGGILWVPIGKNSPDPRDQITDMVVALTGDAAGCATLMGAGRQLQNALAQRRVLLVIDDVWDPAQIKAILEASSESAHLITTRNVATLPQDAVLCDVGTMDQESALRLLAMGLPAGADARLAALAERLGRWPVLLRLANRALHLRVTRQHTPLSKALDAAERDLMLKGVVAFDPQRQVSEREQAVTATVEASLELLTPDERQRYAELAIFPQDVAIPLQQAAALWQLTGGMDDNQSEVLVTTQLDPASLLDYDGNTNTLRLHDVLRSFMHAKLAGKAQLHQRLAELWGERPAAANTYAWRWLAFHRAQAAQQSAQPRRHELAAGLVELVTATDWQQRHEQALQDLPSLRQALAYTLEAAVADDAPLGIALIVRAADALTAFNRRYARVEPLFDLAQQGDLDAARRRATLFDIEEHWRQVLLLTVAWLAAPTKPNEARKLCQEVQAQFGPYPALHHLLAWIQSDLAHTAPPEFGYLVPREAAEAGLIEELLKRVGGGDYDREFIMARGLDPAAQNPDVPPPTRGLYRETIPGVGPTNDAQERTTTRYLAELDGPYLVAYAAQDAAKGMEALQRYLSVYTNYSYPEYRFATLWLLLGYVVQLPRPDGAQWVREAATRIIACAVGGPAVEFEQGLPVAVLAMRAQDDAAAHQALQDQTRQLTNEAARLKPGRDRDGSDIWGQHKRLMLAHTQALGWLLGDTALAEQILQEALALGDSGFAGFQAPACWALAEALQVCDAGAGKNTAAIGLALQLAQTAAHNVQDPTFCARMTARVNALRLHWWPNLDVDKRASQLPEAVHLPELSALHVVGHAYEGRRGGALELPNWANEVGDFDALEKLYRRSKVDFLRLNGGGAKPLVPFASGDRVAVPDAGFVPHLAARLAAEVLAQAGSAPLVPQRLRLLRMLVPFAVPSPTALDSVLTRLTLATARSNPQTVLADALDAAIARRPPSVRAEPGSELTVANLHLPA